MLRRPTARQVLLAALVAANGVPLLGVLALGWRVGDILILFWAESAIIGLFTIVKVGVAARWLAFFAVPFFVVHFGVFMSVHFVFLYVFFLAPGADPGALVLAPFVDVLARTWPALVALVLSHGVSFVHYYVEKNEERSPVNRLMSAPYARVIVMHVTLVFGAVPVLALGQPVYALVLLVLAKIVADAVTHVRAHHARRKAAPAATDAAP